MSVVDDRSLWNDKFNRELKSEADLVGIVEDVTQKIVNELRLKLGRTQRRYETDLPTLDLFWRARAIQQARMPGARAIPLFKEVITKDPTYAPALAALALAHGDRSRTYPDARGAAISPVEAAAEMPLLAQALAVDPDLAEGHARSAVFMRARADGPTPRWLPSRDRP